MTYREGTYQIDTGKGIEEFYAQLQIVGGALIAVALNGTIIKAYAPGAWRSVVLA